MTHIDLHFPVLGDTLPTDHGYGLYAALSRLVPALHDPHCPVQVGSITGAYAGNGMLRLDRPRSRLRLRLTADLIPAFLPLVGKSLEVAGHQVRLGVPQVLPLIPAPALIARLVTLKASSPLADRADKTSRDRLRTRRYLDPGEFLAACRRQLDKLGVTGEPDLPLIDRGTQAGKPRRHVLTIKDRRVVGFSVQIAGLTAGESLTVQEHGLGGKKKMGCGFFVPLS